VKPHVGTWQGRFVARNVTFSITITLEQVNDDGTLYGRFQVLSNAWEGPNDGEIQNGSYSPFGTIHLEQENEVAGKAYHDRIKFDGRFDVPDKGIGVMWGTVLVSHQEPGAKPTDVQTGTLVAALADLKTDKKDVARDNVWNDDLNPKSW
jgi:hypothetical protein